MNAAELIVLDPGHFHASLVQKRMYPGTSTRVSVYSQLGPDLLDYLQRIAGFNARNEQPTSWEIELHTSPDFFDRMLRERPGNVVVLAGRNRSKIDRILASVKAGLNVLADKPWIITSADLPKLERVLEEADQKGLVAYDIMTERFEISSILQRELVNDAEVFGNYLRGTEREPAVSARSVHHLMKVVAGMPLRRPAWFFDVDEYGEGLADVGTHLVDLVQWTLFPNQKLDYVRDVTMRTAERWPTVISQEEFQQVTGHSVFPQSLMPYVHDGLFDYYCNNSVHYSLRGVHVKLEILWNWKAMDGGDIYEAAFHGSKASIEVRQGERERYIPELYVVPNLSAAQAEVFAALDRKMAALQSVYPGIDAQINQTEAQIVIPERFRVGHEEHFGQVTQKFFEYLNSPPTLPAWEASNMLAKYYVSTTGVELSRRLLPEPSAFPEHLKKR